MKKLFVLGGNDAEMMVIKALLSMAGEEYVQPNMGWGEHVFSSKELELEAKKIEKRSKISQGEFIDRKVFLAKKDGTIISEIYFVECLPGEFPSEIPEEYYSIRRIDHHGKWSHLPASILQVLSCIELKLSDLTRRWVELIAANDAAYIPGMISLGATPEEIDRVRRFDRSAQGITSEQEAQATKAIQKLTISGRLTTVKLPHSKTATVCDRLFGEYDQLLIISDDGEINFFGDGALCSELKERYEGWNGGSGLGKSGETAFWGGNPENKKEVQDVILNFLK